LHELRRRLPHELVVRDVAGALVADELVFTLRLDAARGAAGRDDRGEHERDEQDLDLLHVASFAGMGTGAARATRAARHADLRPVIGSPGPS
jgi:hypothetical protein